MRRLFNHLAGRLFPRPASSPAEIPAAPKAAFCAAYKRYHDRKAAGDDYGAGKAWLDLKAARTAQLAGEVWG